MAKIIQNGDFGRNDQKSKKFSYMTPSQNDLKRRCRKRVYSFPTFWQKGGLFRKNYKTFIYSVLKFRQS